MPESRSLRQNDWPALHPDRLGFRIGGFDPSRVIDFLLGGENIALAISI